MLPLGKSIRSFSRVTDETRDYRFGKPHKVPTRMVGWKESRTFVQSCLG